WTDRGYYHVGDTMEATCHALTADHRPVRAAGELVLFKIGYEGEKVVEKAVETVRVETGADGESHTKLKIAKAGQYRLFFKMTDSAKHTVEGANLFVVQGEGFDGKECRFNDLELITDRREYAPGDKVKLL